jgi:ER degradation enhancer, mannosidase alpha-like 2
MRILFVIAILLTGFSLHAQNIPDQPFSESLKKDMQAKIIEACRHGWEGYKTYAWGYDDLRPLTKTGRNWHSRSLLMTPVDAYDTFIMLGMKKEASEVKKLILDSLDFNRNDEIQVFEITIRLLGGLLTAYEMDGDKKFLALAKDLGDRMMPAFNTPTGMPYRYVNLQTGKLRDSINNPAEIGTLMLEFGMLSKHTGNNVYYKAAKRAMLYVFEHRSRIDLVGTEINVMTGEWTDTDSHIGGKIDSYYEYLYKAWLLFHDNSFFHAWNIHKLAIEKWLVRPTPNGSFYAQVNMHTGAQKSTVYGALDAFYAGLLAYSENISAARQVQKANFYMWEKFSLEPESFDFVSGKMLNGTYILRPENIESCFYLHRETSDWKYLWMGKKMVDDILKHCRNDVGFASLRNVQTKEKTNSMQSFFFSETMKYAYLLFDNPNKFKLGKYVFNTEAHPFEITAKTKRPIK